MELKYEKYFFIIFYLFNFIEVRFRGGVNKCVDMFNFILKIRKIIVFSKILVYVIKLIFLIKLRI